MLAGNQGKETYSYFPALNMYGYLQDTNRTSDTIRFNELFRPRLFQQRNKLFKRQPRVFLLHEIFTDKKPVKTVFLK